MRKKGSNEGEKKKKKREAPLYPPLSDMILAPPAPQFK